MHQGSQSIESIARDEGRFLAVQGQSGTEFIDTWHVRDWLESMIQTTIKNGVRLSNTKGRKGYIYIYDIKQTIGKTYNGKPTSRLKVVVIDGKVKTCYPY